MPHQVQLLVGREESSLTYVEYYGLVEAPFTLTPNPRFIYQSRSHAAAFDEVLRSVNRREGLIVVTGEIGTGKTTLCRAVLERLTRRTFASVILNPLLSAEDLLTQILTDFGLVSVDTAGTPALAERSWHDLVTMLHRFLASLVQIDAHAVIVVDEAQHLNPKVLEQIRLLSNFETSTAKLLQIILLGQPNLESLLQRPDMRQLAQRVSRRCYLKPLTFAEVGPYIDRRLWVAHGGSAILVGDPLTRGLAASPDAPTPAEFWRVRLTPAAIRAVAELSAGIPRVINLLCDRALEIGAELELSVIGTRTVLAAGEELAIPMPLTRRWTSGRSLATVAAGSALAAAAATIWWVGSPSRAARPAPPGPAPTAAARQNDGAPSRSPSTTNPAASAAPATPVAVAPGGASVGRETFEVADRYIVAAASFRSHQRAAEIMTQVGGLGLPAFVRLDATSGWNTVFVGPYASHAEAIDAQRQLTRSGFPDTRVIIERPDTNRPKGAT